jgi:hypothetical protein
LERTVGFDVAEGEVLRVAPASESDPASFPDGAVRAVAAHQKSRTNALLAAIVSSKQASESIAHVLERGELDAAFDRASRSGQMIGQHGLGFRLGDEQDERKPRIHGPDVAKTRRRNRPAFEVQSELGARVAARGEGFAESELLQQLERAGLHAEGTRLARPIPKPVDDPESGAEPLKLQCERQSRRTGPNNQDVDVRLALRHLARRSRLAPARKKGRPGGIPGSPIVAEASVNLW